MGIFQSIKTQITKVDEKVDTDTKGQDEKNQFLIFLQVNGKQVVKQHQVLHRIIYEEAKSKEQNLSVTVWLRKDYFEIVMIQISMKIKEDSINTLQITRLG